MKTGIAALVVWLAMVGTIMAAWVTHVLVCIKAAAWILLVIGIFAPPIGWLHGIAIWFGFAWL